MRTRGTAQAVAFTWKKHMLRLHPGPGTGGWRCSVGLTVCANCSSPVSVSNMIYRRRLWKSVQLEALVTWNRSDGEAVLGDRPILQCLTKHTY